LEIEDLLSRVSCLKEEKMTDTQSLSAYERTYGALLGLAYGDAIGFPALFHRTFQFPAKRRDFLWNTNRDLARQRIIRLTLPFTHRLAPETLEPFPTDDTEYAVFTAQTLLGCEGEPVAETFLAAWREQLLPIADTLLTGFSERAAIENLRRGVLPPASGNDNPQHYDDSAVARAVAIGLFCRGEPERAARLAMYDSQVTNAEDGVYAAQAMAAAIALLADGTTMAAALASARNYLPADSWVAHGDHIARQCRDEAGSPQDLVLLLMTRLINTVYSYGNAAPETLPAAFALAEACDADLQAAVLLTNAIPKAADSLPAMVGALCGAVCGPAALSQRWQAQLATCRGLCLPLTAGMRLDDLARELVHVE
jgi:ADP-ribosylglycohydrolase